MYAYPYMPHDLLRTTRDTHVTLFFYVTLHVMPDVLM